MTRKHFEALAAALRMARLASNAPIAVSQWKMDTERVADVCARFNPKFDRTRFLKACGVEERR